MLTVTSLSGDTFLAISEVTRTQAINGEREITLSFLRGEINDEFLEDIETGWTVNFEGDTFHLFNGQEDIHGNKEFDTVLDFFHQFNGDWHMDDVENQSMVIENSIPPLFENSDYVLNIIDTFLSNTMSYSMQQNSTERFLYFIDRHDAEFHIPIGTQTVNVRNNIGVTRNDIIIHEDDNLIDFSIDTDTASFCTAMVGYWRFRESGNSDEGEDSEPTRTEEYISPMADKYGVIWGEPIHDERYDTLEGIQEALKVKQEETWETSFEVSSELFEVPLGIGDEVRFIVPSKGINGHIRVVEINEDFDESGDLISSDYTFGNEGFESQHQSQQYESLDNIHDIIQGKRKLPFNVLPNAVRESTNIINAGESSHFEYRRNGIYGHDTENPQGVTRYNANGIGFSRDGGQTFENALTYLGITATAITAGTMTANRISGGMLTSLNNNTTFNLNTGDLEMEQSHFILGNQNGNRVINIHNGDIESIYNGDLTMNFGGYGLEFFNQRADPIGRLWPIYTEGERRPGLGIEVDTDVFNIGYLINGLQRPVFRSDIYGRNTAVSGPFNDANEGSVLRLYANRRIVSADVPYEENYNPFDQPSIELDQSNSTNNNTQYFGGVNARSNAEWQVRWRQDQDTWSSRITAHADGVNVRGTFDQGSSRDYKENITAVEESALDVVTDLQVVSYNLKDCASHIEQIGLISEDSPAVASKDGKSVDIYKMLSYNTKAIQELSDKVEALSNG